MTQRKGESDENFKARCKAYRDAHKDEKAAYNAAYYADNREECLARYKVYYSDNREERTAYNAAYKAAHPESHLLSSYCREDKKRGRDNDLTVEFVRDMIYRPCHYCGGFGPRGYNGLDRMDSSIGHIQSNCVPCCPSCNNKKNTKDYETFLKEVQDNC